MSATVALTESFHRELTIMLNDMWFLLYFVFVSVAVIGLLYNQSEDFHDSIYSVTASFYCKSQGNTWKYCNFLMLKFVSGVNKVFYDHQFIVICCFFGFTFNRNVQASHTFGWQLKYNPYFGMITLDMAILNYFYLVVCKFTHWSSNHKFQIDKH